MIGTSEPLPVFEKNILPGQLGKGSIEYVSGGVLAQLRSHHPKCQSH